MICNDWPRDDVIFEILSEINVFFCIFHVQIPHYLLLSSVYSSRLKVHHKTIIFHCSGYTLCFINQSMILNPIFFITSKQIKIDFY